MGSPGGGGGGGAGGGASSAMGATRGGGGEADQDNDDDEEEQRAQPMMPKQPKQQQQQQQKQPKQPKQNKTKPPSSSSSSTTSSIGAGGGGGGGAPKGKKEGRKSHAAPALPPLPGVISSCYGKRKRDLGADYESILLVIKAVCKPAPHGFVFMEVDDKKGEKAAAALNGGEGGGLKGEMHHAAEGGGGGGGGPNNGSISSSSSIISSSNGGGGGGAGQPQKLGHSLYEFIVRLLGEACLGKRRLNEAGFWLSLTKTVNRLEVEDPGHLRSLLGSLRWQRANRPNAFKILVPRPAQGGEGGREGVQSLTMHGTFPVGITLQEPGVVEETLVATVRQITQGAVTPAEIGNVQELYQALWSSHEPVPLERIPFLRFRRGIEVQQVMRLAGMEEPEARKKMIEEVRKMDCVDKMLLPVTASLLREDPPRLRKEQQQQQQQQQAGGKEEGKVERRAGGREGGREGGLTCSISCSR